MNQSKYLYKLFYKTLTYLFYPIAFFLVLIIRLISPFFLIRWNCNISTRIGHYVENMNIYLCENELGLNKVNIKSLEIFYDREKICNVQIQKMLHRKCFYLPWFIMHPINTLNEFYFDKILDSKRKHELGYYRKIGFVEKNKIAPLSSFDNLNSQDKASLQLSFTNDEIREGNEYLKTININPDEKFISIILRDENYLKNSYKKINFAHHTHRNTDIKYFERTISYLIEKKSKVMIFGCERKKLTNLILKNSKNVYFYDDFDHKNDFINIFLLYKSKFVISSITGLDSVPTAFKIPVIEVGVVPFVLQRTYSNLFLSIFKKYYSKTLNRYLTTSEIFENEVFNIHGDSYLMEEIELMHPSEEDILSACKEMMSKLDHNFTENNVNKQNQIKFKKLYSHYIEKYYPQRAVIENKGTVAEDFLKKNEFFLK
tara:strand:- start:229 stop:1515 length:1287 start_codon:yes stop_codon:yes gene_type:complete